MLENLTVLQLREKILNKEISSVEVTRYYLSQIEKKNNDINAYITVCNELALQKAKYFDNHFKQEKDKVLGGIPIAVKDVFSTKIFLQPVHHIY